MKNTLLITALLLTGMASAQEERHVAPPPPPPPGPTQVVPQVEIIEFPDVDAEFPGGPEAMKKYIQENVVYPEVSRKVGDQGRVYVTFIVERDGSITGVDVMRGGVSPELNAEAIRLVEAMPRWKPAEVKDKTVRARCRLPITFILEGNEKEEKKK